MAAHETPPHRGVAFSVGDEEKPARPGGHLRKRSRWEMSRRQEAAQLPALVPPLRRMTVLKSGDVVVIWGEDEPSTVLNHDEVDGGASTGAGSDGSGAGGAARGPRVTSPRERVGSGDGAPEVPGADLGRPGSHCESRRFRVLVLARGDAGDTVPEQLPCHEDPEVYDSAGLARRLQELHERHTDLVHVADAWAIVGSIRLVEAWYLQLVIGREQVGDVAGHAVYRVTRTALLRVTHLRGKDPGPDEVKAIDLLKSVDLTKGCIYCRTYDLTQSLQANVVRAEDGDASDGGGVRFVGNDRFCWNTFMLQGLLAMHRRAARGHRMRNAWVQPMVFGFFDQRFIRTRSGERFSIALIARRSRHFAGTRFLRRGASVRGDVANEVETEQIVAQVTRSTLRQPRVVSSFVQVRGSIPLPWGHANLMAPKPDIVLGPRDPDYARTARHFDDLARRYGEPLVCLSLIKKREKKPKEQLLGSEYGLAVAHLNDEVRKHRGTPDSRERMRKEPLMYLTFDLLNFAKEASGVSEVLQALSGMCSDSLNHTGLFATRISPDGEPSEALLQTGVQRTSCIDSLDRTNMGQFALGREAIRRQVELLGIRVTAEGFSEIWVVLLDMFTQHGDAIARQYAGSAAMHKTGAEEAKGEASESGRVQAKIAGSARNAFTAVRRYYSNNVLDYKRQEAMDLVHGLWKPFAGAAPSPEDGAWAAATVLGSPVRSPTTASVEPESWTLLSPEDASGAPPLEICPCVLSVRRFGRRGAKGKGRISSLFAEAYRTEELTSFRDTRWKASLGHLVSFEVRDAAQGDQRAPPASSPSSGPPAKTGAQESGVMRRVRADTGTSVEDSDGETRLRTIDVVLNSEDTVVDSPMHPTESFVLVEQPELDRITTTGGDVPQLPANVPTSPVLCSVAVGGDWEVVAEPPATSPDGRAQRTVGVQYTQPYAGRSDLDPFLGGTSVDAFQAVLKSDGHSSHDVEERAYFSHYLALDRLLDSGGRVAALGVADTAPVALRDPSLRGSERPVAASPDVRRSDARQHRGESEDAAWINVEVDEDGSGSDCSEMGGDGVVVGAIQSSDSSKSGEAAASGVTTNTRGAEERGRRPHSRPLSRRRSLSADSLRSPVAGALSPRALLYGDIGGVQSLSGDLASVGGGASDRSRAVDAAAAARFGTGLDGFNEPCPGATGDARSAPEQRAATPPTPQAEAGAGDAAADFGLPSVPGAGAEGRSGGFSKGVRSLWSKGKKGLLG